MYDLFFTGYALWFSVPAILGTLVFVIKMTLMLIGGDADGGLDAGGGLDMDAGLDPGLDGGLEGVDGDTGAEDSSNAFSMLSIQSIAAFMMGAGWGGLGAFRGSALSLPLSLLIAVVCGVGMVWLLALLLKAVYDLQSSGNISIREIVSREAEVYVRIPGGRSGYGRVRVVFNERMRMYNAVTEDEEPLTRATRVLITKANADNTVTVTAI